MGDFLKEPGRIPLWLRLPLFFVERKLGKRMTPPRILSWYPRAALGSAVLEGLVAHDEPEIPRRMLQLIRMQVSFRASCPFCVDMNSQDYGGAGITEREIEALRGKLGLEECFAPREAALLSYVRALTDTPVNIDPALRDYLKGEYSERALVIAVSTAAQVNFWARAIQGLGLPPLGFSESCPLP